MAVEPILYTVSFTSVAVSADQDAISIVAPTDAALIVPRIFLGQYSDAGDAEAEMIGVTLVRGYTTVGSGGAAVTPAPFDEYSAAAGFTARRNDTTLASAGTAVTLWAETFNAMAGFLWDRPIDWNDPKRGQIVLKPSTRLVARILTDPADALTMNGSMLVGELR